MVIYGLFPYSYMMYDRSIIVLVHDIGRGSPSRNHTWFAVNSPIFIALILPAIYIYIVYIVYIYIYCIYIYCIYTANAWVLPGPATTTGDASSSSSSSSSIKPLLEIFNACRSLTGVGELNLYRRSSMNVEV